MRCKDVNSIKPTAYGKLFRKKNNKTQNVENKEWRVNMPMKRVSVFCKKKKKRESGRLSSRWRKIHDKKKERKKEERNTEQRAKELRRDYERENEAEMEVGR